MPKKFSINDKKAAAAEREEGKKSAAKEKAAKDAEDAYWRSQGEGEKSRAAAKREEEERKRQEAAARKAENKRLAEEEEAAIAARKDKLTVAGVSKVTKYQLETQKDLEARMKEEEARERALAAKREVDADAYERSLVMGNTNRVGADGAISASGLDAAVAALSLGESEADKHPEKRMKAAWKAYEERQMPILKQEKPGLKMSQYKDLLWRQWQKAPENPMNQPK